MRDKTSHTAWHLPPPPNIDDRQAYRIPMPYGPAQRPWLREVCPLAQKTFAKSI